MEPATAIQHILEYIDRHIDEPLSIALLAQQAGYSAYHFCRLFRVHCGTSPMEYLRRRRLLLARSALFSQKKILDIALSYGFETASGFSKAFRREFGYSPSLYLAYIQASGRLNNFQGGTIFMEPIIQQKAAFRVAGYGLQTQISDHFSQELAAYWDTYHGENMESRLYAQLCPPKHGEVGICLPSPAEDGSLTYLFGVIVPDFSRVTPDMQVLEVPAATYAVFTTPLVDNIQTADCYQEGPLSLAVKSTWRYIFEQWLPASKYRFDEHGCAFEFYDERCHGEKNAVADLYIPIRDNAE